MFQYSREREFILITYKFILRKSIQQRKKQITLRKGDLKKRRRSIIIIVIAIEIGSQRLRNIERMVQFVKSILENTKSKEKSNGDNNQNETSAEHANLTWTATHLANSIWLEI